MGKWWVIDVTGYGCFLFEGSKVEAEEMREHKAVWEGGIGRMRRATPGEISSGKVERSIPMQRKAP